MNSHPLQQIPPVYVQYRGQKLVYFGGCDYFRLASHPAVHRALRHGLKKYGLNVAASRATTGNHRLYEHLEKRLAEFFGTESAVLLSSGYLTNMAATQAMARKFDCAFFDGKCHGALLDALDFLRCPNLGFAHGCVPALQAQLAQYREISNTGKIILLCDGVLSSNGQIAPVADYLEQLSPDGVVLVDDAHGAGVLGATGQGTPQYWNVARDRLVQTITLSKAFGVYGGAILGSAKLMDKIRNTHLFIGNTPLPLPLASAALESLRIMAQDSAMRERLTQNIHDVKSGLQAAGYQVAATPVPIVSIVPKSVDQGRSLKKALLNQGIFPSFIHYPGGPASGYFRFAVSSEHTREHIDALVMTLQRGGGGDQSGLRR